MRLNIQHFVVTSVLAHAGLLAAWAGSPLQQLRIPAADSSAPTIQVALQTHPKQLAPLKPKRLKPMRHRTHQSKPRTHNTTPRPQSVRTPPDKPIAQTTPIFKPPAAAIRQVNHPAQLQHKAIRARVLSRIRTDLQQYFVYPILAQRRGWQGRVLLAFSVEANGRIRNIHVASGSGYPILDSSAVDALSRVPQLYRVSEGIQGKAMNLKLPVIFQLQGG